MSNNLLFSFDLRQAEWVVVAYDSRDGNMTKVLEDNKDPHTWTGHLISGVPEALILKEHKLIGQESNPEIIEEIRAKKLPALLKGEWFLPRSMSIRQAGKKSNHALNYDETAERFALENELEYPEARRIWGGYHAAYPGVQGTMHQYVQKCLRKDRTLVNCWGERRKFLDAWGRPLFKDAYAYTPQSTVCHITDTAMIRAFDDKAPFMRPLEILQEVYDSLMMQYPTIGNWKDAAKMVKRIHEYMRPKCSYWGRDFYIEVDLKVGRNASDMIEMDIPNTVAGTEKALKGAWKAIQDGT